MATALRPRLTACSMISGYGSQGGRACVVLSRRESLKGPGTAPLEGTAGGTVPRLVGDTVVVLFMTDFAKQTGVTIEYNEHGDGPYVDVLPMTKEAVQACPYP